MSLVIPNDHPIHGHNIKIVDSGVQIVTGDEVVTVSDEMMAVRDRDVFMTVATYETIRATIESPVKCS